MRRDTTFRRRVWNAALMALGGALTLSVWVVLHPAGGSAGTTRPTVVDGFMSQVETPSPGEFPTPASAVKYAVAQVRTQNLDGMTRVLPLKYRWDRETFRWQSNEIRSVQLSSFFPKQPLSKLASIEISELQNAYTFFGLELLRPGYLASSTIIINNAGAEQALEAQLDPARLSGIFVASTRVTSSYAGPNIAPQEQLGVTRIDTVRAVIGGIGPTHSFDFTVEQFGSNWLVAGVDPANP